MPQIPYLNLDNVLGEEERLQTEITPSILSASKPRLFYVSWRTDLAHQGRLEFGLTRTGKESQPLIAWPIPVSFVPKEIVVVKVPGSHLDIKYDMWSCEKLK